MSATPSLFNQHLPPLADRVRPQSLSGFIGQSHLIDPEKILSKLLEKDQYFHFFSGDLLVRVKPHWLALLPIV